jgi:hypothetical protein
VKAEKNPPSDILTIRCPASVRHMRRAERRHDQLSPGKKRVDTSAGVTWS